MKKVGLVGGISWTSTLDYYRYLNEGVNERMGGLNFADCLICSVNFHYFQHYNSRYDWDATFKLLAEAADSLKRGGAEAIALCANTAHIVADRIEEHTGLPLINIISATSVAIKKQQLKTVGLLGTSYTMELPFYRDKLQSHAITPLIPENQEDRDFIEEALRYELGKGFINPVTKERYLSIIQQLITRGAEGIVLGCTEIPLLITQNDVPVPVFDTTRIHASAIVDFMMK